MKKELFISCLMALCLNMTVYSQSFTVDSLLSRTTIGLKTGINFPWLSYTDPDLQDYKSSAFGRGIFGLFLETELNQDFSLRPELLFTGKGQKIENLGISYQMKSNYFEIRMPFLYTKHLQSVSPYLLLGPALSFATGGEITFDKKKTDITGANIAATDFGFIAGAGVKIPLQISNFPAFLTAELSYTHGLTDTYSEKERKGKATALNLSSYDIDGTRKNRGVELTASLAIPLNAIVSAFTSHKKSVQKQESELVAIDETVQPTVTEYINDCYEIEDILSLLNAGEDVNNKKICLYNLEFEFNKSTIQRSSIGYLKQIVQLLQNFPTVNMKIVGHADSIGTHESNLKLSKERALAVYSYLIKQGVQSSRLSYEYYGSAKPIASNVTEEGRKKNRRVEFVIKNDDIQYGVPEYKTPANGQEKDTLLIENVPETDVLFAPPSISEQYINSASEKLAAGDYKGAIADYTSALSYDSKNADIYNNRGVAYFNLGKYTSAIRDFKSALKINPNFEIAKDNKKLAHAKRGEKTVMILNAVSAGLNATSATLNTINSIQTSNTVNRSESYSQPAVNTSSQPKICTYCNGTGWVDDYVATFGLGGTKWCDFCKRDVPTNHCCQCKKCPSCLGKGKK